jgi:dTMP kinase
MTRGKFIVVDGGEGAGKGTHLTALRDVLPEKTVLFTREPGGTELAEMIRNVIMSTEAKDADALTNFFLFWAARADHVARKIKPALESGINVISDRFDSSTFAYQLCGQENNFLRELFENSRKMLEPAGIPDLYIYLDVEPEVGLIRAKSRSDGNHYDDREERFHHRVRMGYLEFLKSYPHVIIDANRPIEEVRQAFIKAVTETLG